MTIWAIIRTQFEAVHKYSGATGKHDYLAYPHRHIFHVKVSIEQFHDNRDIEYLAFRDWIDLYLVKHIKPVHYSCEMYALALMDKIQKEYSNRKVSVEVSEDGENGARVNEGK